MRYMDAIYLILIMFFGMTFYFMLLGVSGHLYEIEDRLIGIGCLEVRGG